MKHLRLIAIAFALTACTAASIAIACGDKTANASASNKAGEDCCATKAKTTATAASAKGNKSTAACTAEMAANCTPEMKAACNAMKTTAASAKGNTNATVASMDHCAGKKASATTASMDHCAAMKNTATAANASCSMKKNATTAMAAGSKCSSHGSASAMAHGDCSACEDLAMCEEDVRSSGARSKVVALKNGAMVVYTADSPENVRAVQTTVSRRNEQMLSAMKASTDGKLCNDCRSMRGAMASGKLHREVVNVESGCMTLITSTDRAIVQKIHAMTGAQMAVHVKN